MKPFSFIKRVQSNIIFRRMPKKETFSMPDLGEPAEKDRPNFQTVLVVEDDVDLGELIVQVLRDETPYQAILATDAFQALKMVTSLKPKLFVLDYQLPRMNGLDLYDHIHAMAGFEHIPALFLSANLPGRELEKRSISAIRKPFELEELVQVIKQLLSK
jgi:CheY-like chemotaxis protein